MSGFNKSIKIKLSVIHSRSHMFEKFGQIE